MLVMLSALFGLLGPAGAAPAQISASDIVDELDATGRYAELELTAAEEATIDEANDAGIAFVWLGSGQEPERLAQSLSLSLDDLGSPYRTVLVLSDSGVAAWSETVADATIEDGLDASFDQFASGATTEGIESFTRAVGQLAGSGSSPTTTPTSSDSSGSSGGGNLGKFLLIGLLGGGGFLLFRSLRNRSKAKKAAAAELEADRAEIKEQLRDNADHVLQLGDRVIKSGEADLMTTYEQASSAYQEVSQSIEQATSAAEIDALDDKIDHAEWQFESIEAQLEGRPVPPSPAEVAAQAEAAAAAQADQPALGPDESVIRGGSAPPRTQTRRPSYRSGSRSRGGLGGILGSIILGSGGLGGDRSRRSERRNPSSRRGGGLGGGVLNRRSPSSRRPSSNRRPRSSRSRSGGGSRSFGRRGGGGSRRF
jgi:hypothetical protein